MSGLIIFLLVWLYYTISYLYKQCYSEQKLPMYIDPKYLTFSSIVSDDSDNSDNFENLDDLDDFNDSSELNVKYGFTNKGKNIRKNRSMSMIREFTTRDIHTNVDRIL